MPETFCITPPSASVRICRAANLSHPRLHASLVTTGHFGPSFTCANVAYARSRLQGFANPRNLVSGFVGAIMAITVVFGQFHDLAEGKPRFAAQNGYTGTQMNNPTLPGETCWQQSDIRVLVERIIQIGLPAPLVKDGFITVTDRPGLGIDDLNSDLLMQHLQPGVTGICQPTDRWDDETLWDRTWR